MANTKVRGITIELGADTSGIQKALKDVNSSISSTSKELKDIDKLLKFDPGNTELLAQKQQALSKIIGDTKDKMEILNKAMEDLNKEMADGGTEEQQKQMAALQREYISCEQSLKGYEGQLEDMDKDVEDVAKDTETAEKNTGNFGDTAKKAGKAAAAAFAAVAAAMVGVTKGLASIISDTAEYGDEIDKQSRKMGISAEAYQEWDFVLQHAGSSMDAMSSTMKKLTVAAEDGNDAFTELGITQEELASMSQEELFARTIKELQSVEDGSRRTYLASKLLGKGATELGALFDMTAEETEDLMNGLSDLGGLMSDEAVAASAAFQDSLQNVQTALDGLKYQLGAEFLPSVTTVMDGLTEIFKGNKDEGLKLIREGINDAVKVVTDMMPEFIELAADIILTLAESLVENIPNAVPAIIDVVMALVDTIIENLPLFVESAIQIIVAIIQGIAEALPQLIPAIIDAIITMVDTLLDNLDLIIEAAIQIVVALIEGLIEGLPQLIEYLPTIVIKIVDALVSNVGLIVQAGVTLLTALITNLPQIIIEVVKAAPQIIEALFNGLVQGAVEMAKAGWALLEGLWNGIKEAAVWLWDKVTGWLNDLWGGIKSFFGIKSPSKQMHWIGEMLTEGLAEGIDDTAQTSIDAAMRLVNGINGTMMGLSGGQVGIGLNGSSALLNGFGGGGITMNVYGAEGQNINVLADTIMDRIQYSMGRSNAVYA